MARRPRGIVLLMAASERLVGGPYDGRHVGEVPCEESPDQRVVRVFGPPPPAKFEPTLQARKPQPRQALKFTRHEYVREDDGCLTFRRSF